MKKYLLSELYGRIGQILQEHGDMEIVRDKIWPLDVYDNQSLNQVNLHRECFKPFILKDGEGRFVIKKFVINILEH
jgi:hypothetical protein